MLYPSFLLALCFVCRTNAKAAFAHFMVGNTAQFTVADWQNDIALARDAHIDGFALNMAANEATTIPQLSNAFTAANNLGNFKLFFSFDYAGNGSWAQDTVISLINQYKNNGAYYPYNGKPLVSTFEGVDNASDWTNIKARTGCFFIPSYSSLGARAAVATGVVDGLFSWGGWPEGPNNMYTNVDESYRAFLGGKPYMMPVSPWFFTNMPGYGKNWLWRGDDLWFDRWQQVNFMQPELVQIISWNDFGESHHIGPLNDKEYVAFGANAGKPPFNYALNLPHDGWRLFLPFMIDQYKNNISSVTREGLVSWYRPSLSNACASGGTTGNTASQLQKVYQPSEIAQDKVFFSALLGSAADVRVTIGGASITGQWDATPDGGVGIYHGSIPISGRTGQVTITISRSGATIASIAGRAISNTCTNSVQNWNPWVGSSSAANPIPVRTPPRRLEAQVCVKGTGPGNYAGLCDFSCYYGYCPSICTCRAMGLQRVLPVATDTNGCPKAGLDVTYLGLCSFACNRGYCPDTCVIKPKGFVCTAPLPADPVIPACVSGTGPGNFEGLCRFSCNFGFCPSPICTCLNAGPKNAAPPVNEGRGVPIGPDDKGLCNYACTHGYCPSTACNFQAPLTEDPNVQRFLNPYLKGCNKAKSDVILEAWSEAATLAKLHYQWVPGWKWQNVMDLYMSRSSRRDGGYFYNGPLAKNVRRQYEIHEAYFGGRPRYTYAYFYCDIKDVPTGQLEPGDMTRCDKDDQGRETLAFTWTDAGKFWTNHYMVLCPAFFDDNILVSLKKRTEQADNNGMWIDNIEFWAATRAVTVFHETYHWNGTVSAPPALCDLEPEVYDVDDVIALAVDSPAEAARNAENWSMAAIAIFVIDKYRHDTVPRLTGNINVHRKSDTRGAPKNFIRPVSLDNPVFNPTGPDVKRLSDYGPLNDLSLLGVKYEECAAGNYLNIGQCSLFCGTGNCVRPTDPNQADALAVCTCTKAVCSPGSYPTLAECFNNCGRFGSCRETAGVVGIKCECDE